MSLSCSESFSLDGPYLTFCESCVILPCSFSFLETFSQNLVSVVLYSCLLSYLVSWFSPLTFNIQAKNIDLLSGIYSKQENCKVSL